MTEYEKQDAISLAKVWKQVTNISQIIGFILLIWISHVTYDCSIGVNSYFIDYSLFLCTKKPLEEKMGKGNYLL